MNVVSFHLALLVLLAGHLALAQTMPAQNAPPVEDFKPASTNQPGKHYPQVNSEGRVRVRIVAPQAQSVLLDIGAVKYPLIKDENGAWVGESRSQDEGFHYYQINIDGASVPDPSSLYFYGANRWGSGVEIPAHDEDIYALRDVPHGKLSQVLYFSKSSNALRRCFVYTPPAYDQDLNQRFPVLYLQHGAGEDETGWGSQGHANLIMDNLIAAGKAKPFIIVMDFGGNISGGRGPGRAAPATQPAGAPPSGARGGPGGGRVFNFSAFEHILVDDLIPFIDANYRTLADQPHRAMAGLSMGGMQTRVIAPAHLDKFSYMGVFSGGTISPRDINDMDTFKEKVKLVFMSFGGREGGSAGLKASADALNQAGVKSVIYVSPLTAHEWQSWRRSLDQFAPLLFQD